MLVDKETGQVIEPDVILIGKKPKHIEKQPFVKLFIAFLPDIVEDNELAGKAIRLFFYMLEEMEFNTNEVVVIPSEAIERLKITKATFYRWLDILLKKGLIDKIGRYKYRVNYYVAVKGSQAKVIENLSIENLSIDY